MSFTIQKVGKQQISMFMMLFYLYRPNAHLLDIVMLYNGNII